MESRIQSLERDVDEAKSALRAVEKQASTPTKGQGSSFASLQVLKYMTIITSLIVSERDREIENSQRFLPRLTDSFSSNYD